MNSDLTKYVKLVELRKDDASLLTLKYRYSPSDYYDVSIIPESASWKIALSHKPFEKTIEKYSESKLFETHIEEARAFAAELNGE